MTYWIIKIPNSNTDTSVDLHASTNGGLVILTLLCQVLWGLGLLESDIKLRDSDIETKSCEVLHVDDLRVHAWSFADDEMALETNTINTDTSFLKRLDDVFNGSGGLWTRIFNVVVVVVELGIGVSLSRRFESDLNVVGSDDLEEDVVT